MKIEHLAIWVDDLENMKKFYSTYFNLKVGEKYTNPKKKFSSYFLSFQQGARLELMYLENKASSESGSESHGGLAHFAIAVGSRETVDRLTALFKNNGLKVIDPRTTGDGYYESIVFDPEGNQIELTI